MKPIRLEVVTKMLTSFGQCRRCEMVLDQTELGKKSHQKQMEEYPSELKEEDANLWEWIRELSRLYKHRLLIRLIDVQSPLGFYKSLRYWIRTYPTFIIEGKETYSGWDRGRLETLLDRYIKNSLPSVP